MFFTKTEYMELELPFIYEENPKELWDGMISIEAYGNILGERRYCYAVFSIEPEIAEELAVLLREKAGESIKVVLKVKKGKVKGFRIDLESLAEVCCDERFQDMELLCWGFNEKSFREL